jgi:phosphoenolpyruvate carboxykinase (ATP)
MNYILPLKSILPMHCAANVGISGDTALFFGLSGTGKTTLSSDPDRRLIGDDEHGWTDQGVFNYEGGCYAKTIRLRKELEPIIWRAIHRFGSVLENVVMDPVSRTIDFDNSLYTENTRAAYPLEFVDRIIESGCANHPKHIFFLCADAFGVLPPISRLDLEQAVYYFLSGYTAKIAGTEKSLGKEPSATFSTCFAAPFLPLSPLVYAKMFSEKVQKSNVRVWLINTGWTGGRYGSGTRIPLVHTRAMINAALLDKFDNVLFHKEEYFNLQIPEHCQDVPTDLLNPILTWRNRADYQQTAATLVEYFSKNFVKFESKVSRDIILSGPGNHTI